MMSERLHGVAIGVVMSSIAFCLYGYLSAISTSTKKNNIKSASSSSCSRICTTTTTGAADDDCNSLFYGSSPASNGSGFPSTRTVDSKAIQVMKTVHKVYTRLVRLNHIPYQWWSMILSTLTIYASSIYMHVSMNNFSQPFDFYKQAVENMPIVCVDVICKRSDGKVLLFYRRDKPVAHLWWW